MTKIYAILLNTKNRPVPFEAIKKILDSAKDWCRYDLRIWLVATNLSANQWYERVRPVLDPTDDVLVVAVDIEDRQGWACVR